MSSFSEEHIKTLFPEYIFCKCLSDPDSWSMVYLIMHPIYNLCVLKIQRTEDCQARQLLTIDELALLKSCDIMRHNYAFLAQYHECQTIHSRDGKSYVLTCMEYIPGMTLAAYVTTQKPDLSILWNIGMQLFHALHVLHDTHQLIHRDIKLENIIWDDTQPDHPRIVLLDFGWSCTLSQVTLTSPPPCGTLDYLSPEIVNPLLLDNPRQLTLSDVWAAGVVLYESMEGRPPFFHPEPLMTLQHLAHPFATRHISYSPTCPFRLKQLLSNIFCPCSSRWSALECLEWMQQHPV